MNHSSPAPQYSTIAIRKGAARSWKYSTHIHYYFVSLLVADLIQATGMRPIHLRGGQTDESTGGVLDAKWVAEGVRILAKYRAVSGFV